MTTQNEIIQKPNLQELHKVTYSTWDLVMIALFAALGLGTKQVIGPIVKSFTALLFIPGGAVAGGFYMLWLTLARILVRKPMTASFTGIAQALAVLILPYGSHGVMTLITYTTPGLAIDIVYYSFLFLLPRYLYELPIISLYTATANTVGTFFTAITYSMFIGIPITVILLILGLAFFSGSIGGIIAYYVSLEYNDFFGEYIEADDEPLEVLED